MGVVEASQREVEKKPYRNQTAGWQGVTKLDHLGAQVGDVVEPYGTVWLTDDEAKLTARAPANAHDNPFLPKKMERINEKGEHIEEELAPLVLVSSEDGAPEDRFVPTSPILHPDAALIAAGQRDADEAIEGHDPEERPIPTTAAEPVLASSERAAVPPSHTQPGAPHPHQPAEAEQDRGGRGSWLPDRSEVSEEPQPGNLSGSEGLSDEANAPEGASVAATTQVTSPAPGAEEHAAHTEEGEETGAAATPAQPPAEGEFAQHEEVGSPDAPAQGEGQ